MRKKNYYKYLFLPIISLIFINYVGSQTPPVRIILDTDLGPDSDDAGAMAVLHALSINGEADILGVMCSTKNPWAAPCADAINTYYHRPDIPVGTLKGSGFAGGSEEWYGDSFNGFIAGQFDNKIRHGEYASDAVNLYRKLLSKQPDHSVRIVVTGPLTNLRYLLNSISDPISQLDGKQLIEKKVNNLVVMGGSYPNGEESNFMVDPEATRQVVDNWPTPIMFTGYEIGEEILTGKRLAEETPDTNPVRVAYHLWDLHFARRFDKTFDPDTGIWPHSSYDQTAVLFAVRGLKNYWTAVTDGYNSIEDNGSNKWQPTQDRKHSYLVELMPRDELARIIEDLMIVLPAKR